MRDSSEQGFTVIEMLVTVIVAATFAVIFYQLFITSIKLNDTARRGAIASEIAYSNLKKYPNAASVGGTANCALPNNSNIVSDTSSTYPDIGQVREVITRSWPFACTNPEVVKLESTASYKGETSKVGYVIYLK